LQMQKQQQAEEIQAPRSLPENLERKYESEWRIDNSDYKKRKEISH
jgi:hypothetical protein